MKSRLTPTPYASTYFIKVCARIASKVAQLTGLLIVSSSTVTAAIVNYQYTGNTYTEIFLLGEPYESTMRVTGTFTVASPLEGHSGEFTPLSWSFNDGVHTLTSAEHFLSNARMTTDSEGMPTSWGISVLDLNPPYDDRDILNTISTGSRSTGTGVDQARLLICIEFEGVCGFEPIGSGLSEDVPGSWEVSAIPIPAAVWLFGSGLIGLVGMARRKAA